MKPTIRTKRGGTHYAPMAGPKPIYKLSELAEMAQMELRALKRLLKRHEVRVISDGAGQGRGRGRAQLVMLAELRARFPDLVASIEMARREAPACPNCGGGVKCCDARECGWVGEAPA